MLQTQGAATTPELSIYEDRDEGLDPARLIGILRRRVFYFAVPFVLLITIGVLFVAIQKPIYHAEGKILVESPEIPVNLVTPTVTATATERIQVIQQRIMTRDNLLSIVKKFGLFPSEQRWMSGTELLDLMRQRAAIELVDIDTALPTKDKDGKPVVASPRPNKGNNAVAFTMTFEYENPELAAKVANEFLTLILNEDVRARTNRATETTHFLAREVKRLQGELDSIDAEILEATRAANDPSQLLQDVPEAQTKQVDALTAMKTDLIQKTSVYSEEHPAVKALKKRIAALEKEMAQKPAAGSLPAKNGATAAMIIAELKPRQEAAQKQLDDASKKLIAAQLGESMERDQQAEHLTVIEQPTVPQTPVKPKRLKLLVMVGALATMVSAGAVVSAELFDKTIRSSRELAGLIDSHLLVVIPYISTAGETLRTRRRIIFAWVTLAVILLAGLALAYIAITTDYLWFAWSWLDFLSHLTK